MFAGLIPKCSNIAAASPLCSLSQPGEVQGKGKEENWTIRWIGEHHRQAQLLAEVQKTRPAILKTSQTHCQGFLLLSQTQFLKAFNVPLHIHPIPSAFWVTPRRKFFKDWFGCTTQDLGSQARVKPPRQRYPFGKPREMSLTRKCQFGMPGARQATSQSLPHTTHSFLLPGCWHCGPISYALVKHPSYSPKFSKFGIVPLAFSSPLPSPQLLLPPDGSKIGETGFKPGLKVSGVRKGSLTYFIF